MATYTFTGIADGDPWPAPWTPSTTVNGTATVQTQTGELKTGAAGGWTWLDQARVNYSTELTDVDVVFTMWVAGTNRTPHFYLRNPGNTPDSEAQRLIVKVESDGISVIEVDANTEYPLGTKLTFTPYAAPFKLRARVVGTSLKLKVWTASTTEPAGWGRELTLTTHTAATGSLGFFVVGSGVAASQYAYIDNITITDLATPTPTYVVMTPVGPPTYPGDGVRVLSPNPSPVADPASLTGPRITVGPADDPETLINGTTHPPGTVIQLARGSVWLNKRLIITGSGTVTQPVLVCATGTGPNPVIESVTKPGRFKDDGVIVTAGTHVHVRDVTVLDSLSIAFRPEATNSVLSGVEAGGTVIGAWIAGDGTRMWNSYVHDQVMMPDTPGPEDDYGSVGVVIEAHDVTVEGLTARNCLTETGTDYDAYGGDGGFSEIWMKGNRARLQYGFADRTLRLVEGGGLGPGNTAIDMRINNIYMTQVGDDAPIYFNPVGPYSGLDVTGLETWDNVIVPWGVAPEPVPTPTVFAGRPDGSPWPAPWAASTAVNGTVTVQTGRGRLQSAAAGGWTWLDQARVNHPAASTPDDVQVTFTMWVGGTDRTPHLYLRNPGDSPDDEARRLLIKYEEDGVSVIEVEADVEYPLGTKLAATPYDEPTRTKIRVQGVSLKLKVWEAASPEPAEWDRELTLTAHTAAAGSLGFFLVGSGVAIPQPMYIDDLGIADLNALVATVELTAPATIAATIGEPVTATLTATVGDTSAVTFRADVLPDGVSLNQVTGKVTGAPTTAGTTVTTWSASTSNGAVDTAVTTWTVTAPTGATLTFTGIADGSPWPAPWTASTIVNGTVKVAGEAGQLKTGATGSYSWLDQARVNYPAAPPNVDIVFTMWVTAGERTPHLYLRNPGNTPDSEARRVEIKVASDGLRVVEVQANVGYPLGPVIPFTPYTAPFIVRAAVSGTSLKLRIWAATDTEPAVWDRETVLTSRSALSGSLGFFVVGSSAPTAQYVYVDDVTVTNLPPPAPSVTITAPAARAAVVGQPVMVAVSAVTNDGATVTYAADTLPPGVSLNAGTGTVTGIPTTVGTVTTTWTVTSSTGAASTAVTVWTVTTLKTVTLTAPGAVTVTVGTPSVTTLTAVTGDGATVTYAADALPDGLTLNPANGATTGVPTTAGTVTTTWTAATTSGATDTATTVWTVNPAPPPPPVRNYMPVSRGWRYFATTVNGDGTETMLADALPLTGAQIVDPVSAASELSFDLTPEIMRLKRPDGKPVIRARSTAVYAEIDGVIRSGGIVTGTTAEDATLRVVCAGFSSLIDGEPWTNSTIRYTGADPADVIRTLWRYWQAHPHANIPLELPAALKTGAKVGTVEEPLLLANYATSDLGQVFYDMLEAGSIDFRERHWWDGDIIRHRLDMGVPRLGRRRTDLTFQIGVNVVTVPAVSFDGRRYASEVLVLGAGEGDKMTRAHAVNPGADRLRRVQVLQSKGIGLVPTAQLFARKWAVNYSADERDVTDLTVTDHPVAPLLSWEPGDEVWLSGDAGWGGPVGVWVRILSTTITPDSSSTVGLKVARADKVI